MKKRILCFIVSVLTFAFGATAFATTVSDVLALQQQVSEKIASLQSQTLTKTQQTKLKKAQTSFAKLTSSSTTSKTTTAPKQDSAREAKITAFKATLSASQLKDFEAIMPVMPTKVQRSGSAEPKNSPPPKPSGDTRNTISDADKQAMEAKRAAFIATLNESQKKAYDELFAAPQSGGAPANIEKTQQTPLDLSTLSASQLTKLEKQLKSLLTTVNKIK